MSPRADLIQEMATARVSASGYARLYCMACPGRVGTHDRKRSLSVNASTGWWKCHRCGWVGRLPGYGDEDDHWLVDVLQGDPPDVEQPSDYVPLTQTTALVLRQAAAYLESRGYGPDHWSKVRVGVARHGRLAGRLVIPLEASDDWLTAGVGWVARSMGAALGPKYLTAAGVDRSWALYNADTLVRPGADLVLGVEGVISAWRVWPHAVGYLGQPTDGQLARLVRWTRDTGGCLVQVLDADRWRNGLASAQLARDAGGRVQCVALPAGADPDQGVNPVTLLDAARYAAYWEVDVDLEGHP